MSRSGYVDDWDGDEKTMNLYRGTVARAIKGKRGQAFLREMAAALDAMPDKALVAEVLVRDDGAVCAIGAVCKSRGLDVRGIDYECAWSVGKLVGIARSMAAEIEYENDECGPYSHDESPRERWERMRKWVDSNLVQST